ncbi:MAG: hypothetical protein WAR77_01230 [Saprospiraceae bacterium]
MKIVIVYLKITVLLIIGINFKCTRQSYLQSSNDLLPSPQYFMDSDNDGVFDYLIYNPILKYYQHPYNLMLKTDAEIKKYPIKTDTSYAGIITLNVFVDTNGFVDSVNVKKSLSPEHDYRCVQIFQEIYMAGYAILSVKSKAVAYRMEYSLGSGHLKQSK